MYDIAIIGSGPAGLEAAITAKIRKMNIVLFGSKSLSMKVEKAHTVLNYLGLPNVSGKDMQKAFLNHAQSMGVEITEDRIQAVYAMGESFMLQGTSEMYEAKAVIVATGVTNGKPYPNEEEYLGKGVSYCATCDAALYKGKETIVIASSAKEEKEAEFLSTYAGKVTYIPLYNEPVELPENIEVRKVRPLSIQGNTVAQGIETDQGEIKADGIFILREALLPGQLVPGVELDGPHIKVNAKMETNIPGLYAAGDIAGLPYQYIKSAGQGNTAVLSAVSYLQGLK